MSASFACLLFIILTVFGLAFYRVAEHGFWLASQSHLEDHVHSVFQDLGPMYQPAPQTLMKRLVRPIQVPPDWDEQAQHYVDRLSGEVRRVWVWSLQGKLLYRDRGPETEHAFPEDMVRKVWPSLFRWSQACPDQDMLRVSYLDVSIPEHSQNVLIPLAQGRQPLGYLEVSEQWILQERVLHTISHYCVIVILVSLFLAWLGATLVASQLALPLEILSETCLKAAGGDLSVRSELGPGTSEIYQVSASVDTMVSRLEQAFSEQRRFVADASHELKTPVTAVVGLTEMLKTLTVEGPPERCQRTLDMMERELDRMGQLISDLLELSHLEQKPPPRQDAVEPVQLVQEAAATLAVAFPQHPLRLEAPAQEAWMLGDSHALRRVFRNLLENAFKYSPPGKEVVVTCEADPQRLLVTIRDQGCGISALHLPYIFERFYRVDPSRARGSGGTGLGLAIARSIVENHGGHIEITSEVGVGTVATVVFPRRAGSLSPSV